MIAHSLDAAGEATCALVAPCGVAKTAIHSAANGAFEDTAAQMYQGFDSITKDFLTSWTGNSFIVDIQGAASQWFRESNLPVDVGLFTLGLMVAGIRTMYMVRSEPIKDAVSGAARVLAVTAAGAGALKVLAWASDSYSQYILRVSGTSANGAEIVSTFATQFPALALIFGLVGVLAVGCQWIIMIARDATLPLLTAFWPSAAAASLFRRGQQAFEKVTSWLIAFLFYSPIAAAIYAYAWRLKNGDDGPGGVLTGLTLIGLAVLTLPALMRLVAPAVEAVGRASGGAMALEGVAAAVSAGVAIGAAVATGGGSAAASTIATTGTVGGGTAAAAEGGWAATTTASSSPSGLDVAVGGDGAPGADAPDSGSPASSPEGAGAQGSEASADSSTRARAGWAAAQDLAASAKASNTTAEGMIGD
ncbi:MULTISPECIES: hypothetical protein [Clavibacter]|uniref:TrbL/VirB6 plasmid conjugal transfer protein n=2 Tax=Clavibacter TaxID=1573 RepID=A0A399NY43_9MICO|nr:MULTISPECIES: hypothetical protein [Clavibacter]KDP89794.1 hypothetical protein W824_14975 [Clavibacter cf. michiganensis LMG 26808]RII99073.1 hypothetical protein DZF96_00055 [Clavibacter michiganensis]UKF26690.1 hypothetical protein KYT88_15855 [Clavibacter sp. A6099]